MSAAGPVRAAEATRDDWETPPILFDRMNREFRFHADAAASAENKKLSNYYTGPCAAVVRTCYCGLCASWANDTDDGTIWLNPPYGRGLQPWLEKCSAEAKAGCTVVALLSSSTGANWFAYCEQMAHEIRLLKGRVPFIHAPHCQCKACATGKRGSNTGDSALVIWRNGPRPPTAHVWVWDWRADLA